MIGTILGVLVALSVAADGPEPADLVRRLGSDRFAERVEVTKALEALGPKALPALRAARDSTDPKVRARVADLIVILERRDEIDRITRPTLIKLDFHDRPLSEVVEELNVRHNLGLAFQFGPLPGRSSMILISDKQRAQQAEAKARRITLEAAEPVPFWEAIDRLCQAGSLQYDLNPEGRFGLSAGRFLLYFDLGGTSVASDSGPFRVRITGLHSTFERDFAGPGPIPQALRHQGRRPIDSQLDLRMSVIPEPGLVVRLVGSPKLDEATDDQGRSLLPPDEPKGSPSNPSDPYRQPPTLNGTSGFSFLAALRLPDQTGRSIRRLRGTVPAIVVAYAPDPIVIRMEGSVGKSVRNDDVTVMVYEVATDAQGKVTVEVGVTPNRPTGREVNDWQRTGPPDFVTFRSGQLTSRLQLLDARGRILALDWAQGHGRGDFATMNSRVRLMPRPIYDDANRNAAGGFQPNPGRNPVPVELRYNGFTQTATEIRFDLRDVPLP